LVCMKSLPIKTLAQTSIDAHGAVPEKHHAIFLSFNLRLSL